jgi:hypothetical protein
MSLSTRGHGHNTNPTGTTLFTASFLLPSYGPLISSSFCFQILFLSLHSPLFCLLHVFISPFKNQSFSEHWVSLACSQLQWKPSIFCIKKLCPLDSFLPWRQRQHRLLPTKLRSVTSQNTGPWSTKTGNKSAQTLHSRIYGSSDSKTGRPSAHMDRSHV